MRVPDSPRRFNLHGGSLFVFFQGQNFHPGAFSISAMHGLAVVAQSLLGESFRHPDDFGTFGPSLAVTVQRQANDPKLAATRGKFRGAVAGTDR